MGREIIDDSSVITQSELAVQIFNRWSHDTSERLGKNRFLSAYRDEILSELIDALIEFEINYNTSLDLTKKIVDFLVTKEGKKDQGEYKGWKDDVTKEYSAILLSTYDNKGLPIKIESEEVKIVYEQQIAVSDYGDFQHIPHNEMITAWAKQKFSIFYNEQLDLLSHRVWSDLNTLFLREGLLSDWLSDGKNVPEWAVDFR